MFTSASVSEFICKLGQWCPWLCGCFESGHSLHPVVQLHLLPESTDRVVGVASGSPDVTARGNQVLHGQCRCGSSAYPKFPCALDITALTGSAGIVALHQYPVNVSCYRHKYVLGWGTMTKNISRSWHRSC